MRLSRPNRHRLDPVRSPRWRLRALVVTVLLITAAGLLYAGSGAPGPDSCASTRTTRLLT